MRKREMCPENRATRNSLSECVHARTAMTTNSIPANRDEDKDETHKLQTNENREAVEMRRKGTRAKGKKEK